MCSNSEGICNCVNSRRKDSHSVVCSFCVINSTGGVLLIVCNDGQRVSYREFI